MEQYGYGRYCWYPTEDYIYPVGNWKAVTGRAFDSCGPECPAPPPTPRPTTPVYDPSQDFCFTNNDMFDKFCWYPDDRLPRGNWKGEGGRGYNDCGPKCTDQDASVFDPSQDFCFKDTDNAGKYCWYPEIKFPVGNWKAGARGYNDCGPQCTSVTDCLPAVGTFSGLSETSGPFNFQVHDDAFETCYHYGDTLTKRCWSKSYYESGGWYECVPNGGGWNSINSKLPLYYCDTPCQEVHRQHG